MVLELIALQSKRSKIVGSFFKESTQCKQFDAVKAVIGEANRSDRPENSPHANGVNEERSLIEPEPALQSEAKSQLAPKPSLLGACQYSILIVDDDEDNLLYAHYAVEQLGYRVAVASSGRGAIASAFSFCPDMILLDIMLDDISGTDVLRQLRQHKQFEAVPIIAVTALAHDRDREIAMEAGFADYLVKPYMLDALEAMIKQHLPS